MSSFLWLAELLGITTFPKTVGNKKPPGSFRQACNCALLVQLSTVTSQPSHADKERGHHSIYTQPTGEVFGHGSRAAAPARGQQPGLWWHWGCRMEAASRGQHHCTAPWSDPGESSSSPAGGHAEFPILTAPRCTSMCLVALSCQNSLVCSFQCQPSLLLSMLVRGMVSVKCISIFAWTCRGAGSHADCFPFSPFKKLRRDQQQKNLAVG